MYNDANQQCIIQPYRMIASFTLVFYTLMIWLGTCICNEAEMWCVHPVFVLCMIYHDQIKYQKGKLIMLQAFSVEDLLDEDLVLLDVEADNMEQLLKLMCDSAKAKSYVKDSYLEAVLERERLYPTGLPTEIIKVALPHTMDRSHVLKSGIFIAKLKRPVAFKEMGDGEREVPVDIAFMLAINGDKEQLTVLQNIVGLFTKHEVLDALKNANTPYEIIQALKVHLERP